MVPKLWVTASIIGLLVAALGGFAFLPICDLHFDCGCTWPGVGGHAHCDILRSGPPDCPWCDHTWMGYAAFAGSALAGFVSVWLTSRRRAHWLFALLSGLTTFLLGALAAGILTSWYLGRPLLAGL